jgi:hypothetical protein
MVGRSNHFSTDDRFDRQFCALITRHAYAVVAFELDEDFVLAGHGR